MITPQLVDFIKQQLQAGLAKEKISSELLVNGWNEEDIKEGFEAINIPTPPTPPTPPAPAPAPTPVEIPVSNFPSISINPVKINPVAVKTVSHSSKKMIFFVILVVFLLASGASAYYFKDELVKLPIIKDFFPQEEIILEDVMPLSDATVQTENTIPDTQTNDTSLSIYNDPNGLYSFSYSNNEKIIYEQDSQVALSIEKDDNPLGMITISTEMDSSSLTKFMDITQFKKSSFDAISTYPTDKYTATIKDNKNSITVYESIYVINLGNYNNKKPNILFYALVNVDDQKITDQIEAIIKSFVILPIKDLLARLDKNENTTKDEVVKDIIMNVIRSAELQDYKLHTYTGFCKSDGYVSATKGILKLTALVCKDSPTAYAVTASVSNGYWCTDSTRYLGDAKSLNTGTTCVK